MTPLSMLFFIAGAGIVYTNAAAAVTLYEISGAATAPALTPTIKVIQSGTTKVYPIGTGTDGKTTYVQDNILSFYVVEYPLPQNTALTTTATVVTEAETLAVTFAEDKNGYHATRSASLLPPGPSANGGLSYQPGLDEECVFHPDGTGSCVRVAINIDEASRTVRSTTTYQGEVVPWYTLTDSEAITTSTSAPSPTANTALGRGTRGGMLAVLAAVAVGFASGFTLTLQ